MPQVVDDVASLVEQLTRRIAELEARVSALEHPSTASPAQSALTPSIHRDSSTAVAARPDISPSGSAIAVLGKAVLALAGAFLLRAIAESNPSAQFPMLIAAIVYASGWMTWAVRAHRTNHFASAAYGTTATLILAPLLYEASTRFQLLSVTSSAAVLVAFVVLVLVLAWHSNLEVLPWVGTLASITTLWALIVATHEVGPVTCALLGIALVTEIAACVGHRLSLWAMVAIAADAAVILFIYVMTMREGVPSSYTPASPATTALLSFGLLTIYGGGIAIRSFGQRKRISNFEVLQGAIVFGLAYIGVARASQSAAPIFGVLFLGLSLVCYWGALWRFAGEQHRRNRAVSAFWAVILMLAGVVVVFSPTVGTALLGLLAISALLLQRRSGSGIFKLHPSLYLMAAAVLASYFSYARNALAGVVPGVPHWTIWVVLASALLCYSMAPRPPEERWRPLLFWIPSAVLATLGTVAIAVVALCALIATRLAPRPPYIAGVRTVVTCCAALTLAILASRLRRPELGWLAYAAVGLGAVKLLFEDLRFGNAASLVISLLFYGLILVLLPRLLKPATTGIAGASATASPKRP